MLEQGFLIVEKYEYLYEKYKERYKLTSDCYAMPRIDRSPHDYKIQYRGIDRDCLTPNDVNPRNLAEIRLSELESQKRFGHDDIFYDEIYPILDFVDVNLLDEMYSWLEDDKSKFETIFIKKANIVCEIPRSFCSIGFEPSYFYKDHFSASCDCMLIPRWHGTDEEGKLFLNYFKQLNSFGLFNSIEISKEFLEYYLSFNWTETGDYFITEVFLSEKDIIQ
jgi:hypothetical protein